MAKSVIKATVQMPLFPLQASTFSKNKFLKDPSSTNFAEKLSEHFNKNCEAVLENTGVFVHGRVNNTLGTANSFDD